MRLMNGAVRSILVSIIGYSLINCAGLSLPRGSYNQGLTQRVKCAAFSKWASQFHEKFPGAPHTAEKVALLYTDELFVPVFGTPYDQLSNEQQQQLASTLPMCFDLQTYEGAIYANGNYRDFVSPMIKNPPRSPAVEITRQEILSALSRAKEVNGWAPAALDEARKLPDTDEGYAKVQQLWSRGEQATSNLAPQERSAFRDSLYAEMRRISLGALLRRMNDGIAKATTYDGLKELQLSLEKNRELLHVVPNDVRSREEARAKRAIKDGVQKLMAEEWGQFEKRGTGAAAIRKGAEWYRHIETRYLKEFDIDTVGDWPSRFDTQRGKDLRLAQDPMAELVKAAEAKNEIASFRSQYLLTDELDGKTNRANVPWIQAAQQAYVRTLHPAASIWTNGIPETLPPVQRMLLTKEVLAFLVLKYHADQITQLMWDGLIQSQVDNDKAYYHRVPDKYRNGLQWGMNWDPKISKGYHPKYVPFSPAEFFPDMQISRDEMGVLSYDTEAYPDGVKLIKSDANAVELFKQWAMIRAQALPKVFILLGKIEKQGDQDLSEAGHTTGKVNADFDGYLSKGFAASSPASGLIEQGYESGRILQGRSMDRPFILLLPSTLDVYFSRLKASVSDKWIGETSKSQDLRVELEVMEESVENADIGTGRFFLMRVKPLAVRLLTPGDMSILYEEGFSSKGHAKSR